MVVEGPVSEVGPSAVRGTRAAVAVPTARPGDARPEIEVLEYGPLAIAFDGRVLRPRPWTVLQSRWAAELLPDLPDGDVLELCAGAGHIGLLATRGSGRHLVQVDASPVACHYARLNARTDVASGGRPAGSVEVRLGRMDEVVAAEERFALVVADPPWVPSHAVGEHPEDPLTAIDGGDDGLDLARHCVDLAAAHLLPGGRCVLQVGDAGQALAMEEYAAGRAGRPLTPQGRRSAVGGSLVLLAAPAG